MAQAAALLCRFRVQYASPLWSVRFDTPYDVEGYIGLDQKKESQSVPKPILQSASSKASIIYKFTRLIATRIYGSSISSCKMQAMLYRFKTLLLARQVGRNCSGVDV